MIDHTGRPHFLPSLTRLFYCKNTLFQNYLEYNANIMAVDSWEFPVQTDVAEREYRPINPALVRCVLAEFTDLDFWGKLEMLRQAAHDDPDCSYSTPKGFEPLTHASVAAQHATFNPRPRSPEVAS
jgi:hypothetical protein